MTILTSLKQTAESTNSSQLNSHKSICNVPNAQVTSKKKYNLIKEWPFPESVECASRVKLEDVSSRGRRGCKCSSWIPKNTQQLTECFYHMAWLLLYHQPRQTNISFFLNIFYGGRGGVQFCFDYKPGSTYHNKLRNSQFFEGCHKGHQSLH